MDKILQRNSDGVVEHRVVAPESGPRRVERVYPPAVFSDPVLAARVRERIRTLNDLAVPAIPAHQWDETGDGKVRISRPYLDGTPLRDLIGRRRFSESEALRIFRGLVALLDRLHGEGLVHGGLTPKSIIVAEDDGVALVDFRFIDTLPENLSFDEAHFAYAARYAAPETLTGDIGAKASDLYAAGCILHEIVTGRAPFENDDPVLVAFAHLNEPPALAMESDRCRTLLDRLLRKSPSERFPDAAALLAAIDGAPTALPEPPPGADAPAAPGRIVAAWREVFGGRIAAGRPALLPAFALLLLLFIPLVWFLQLGDYAISYRIDETRLFRSRFDALFRPLLATLPEVRAVATEGDTATLYASGELDKLFLEKIDRLFSSKLLPRCELELSGSREIRIRLAPEERIRQFEQARTLLALKLQGRLQHFRVPGYALASEPPDRVTLRVPRSVPRDVLQKLLLRGRLSIHLLLNPAAEPGDLGTGETRLASRPGTGETLLVHAVPAAFEGLALLPPAEVKHAFALDDRPYALFFNMLGNLNLQEDPARRRAAPLPALLPPGPPPGAKLLVLAEDLASETAIFQGRIARAEGNRFVYDLSDPITRPDDRARPFSALPLVVAVDGEARAIVRNERGLDPTRGVIGGFPDQDALFAFHQMVEAALPDYIEVGFD